MKRHALPVVLFLVAGSMVPGCGFDVFPDWPPNLFEVSPAETGPSPVRDARIEVPEGADGEPTGITVFAPTDAAGPLPALIWVMGSNVQPHYHQSLHETLASWGYAVIIPDARPLRFTDFQYHRRNTDLARQAFELALAGDLGVDVDPERVAIGGYSIGGTMAIFAAAEDPRLAAIVLWAPTGSPFWTGVDPDALFADVTQPSYFLLAEFDHVEPPQGFPQEMKAKMANSEITEYIIPEGLHLYFQQPSAADSLTDPLSSLTRYEQQGIAIERTRAYLDGQFGIAGETPIEDDAQSP